MFKYRLFTFLLFIFAHISHPQANMGLPMIIVVWPLYWLGLIPITLIEWVVMKKTLNTIPSKILAFKIFIANFVSTLVGIPAIWLCLLIVQMSFPGGGGTFPTLKGTIWPYVLGVTLQAPWLVPYESQFYWMIPTAAVVLFIPMFYASYWIESKLLVRMLRTFGQDSALIKKASWTANKASYVFLIVFMLLMQFTRSLICS
jgi:hypothetical protein